MFILGNTPQEKYLWYNAVNGMVNRYGEEPPEDVVKRIEMEMDVITNNKFTDYILMIWDIHDFCKNPDRVYAFCAMMGIEPPPDGIVPIGPGRGSVGGSMVCYCIGIHECDPIRFGLYFERFLNPERIAYPDIDFDISQRYRHIVLAYIAWRYNRKHVAQIITYGTFATKTAIEEVLKSANVQPSVISSVKELVSDDPTIKLADMLKNDKFMNIMKAIVFPDTRLRVDSSNATKLAHSRFFASLDITDKMAIGSVVENRIPSHEVTVKSSWTYDKALKIMGRLEGLNKHESTHAAGVVVAPVELDTNVPLCRKDDGPLVCQYDMTLLEKLGYLKMDALGLRTVDVNHDAERLVRQWYDPNFNIRKIPYNDKMTLDLLAHGDTVGIFQVESSGFTQMMSDIFMSGYLTEDGADISNFMWISAGLAMYRPGPLDAIIDGKTMVQHIIDRKSGKEPVLYLFPEEEQYLRETYGVMVYQEQVMARVRQMTGCTFGRADKLRKAMGKKDKVAMKYEMDWLRENAMKYNFTAKQMTPEHKKQIVDRAIDEIEKFARYGFNKAHTVEYGHICYRNSYLKAHYPVAFYTALLNSEVGNSKRQAVIIRDMMKHDIKLLPPLVTKSDIDFTMTDKDTIRFGLAAIKGLGEKGLHSILDEKKLRGPFKSFENFRVRVPATLCNVNTMTNLAKCGAFDDVLDKGLIKMPNRATLVASAPDICGAISKAAAKKGKNKPKPSIFELLEKLDDRMISYQITPADEDLIEYATWEKEILNYFISAHPMDAYIGEVERWTAVSDTDVELLPDEFYIAGFIASVHETIVKKEGRNKGKAMGFVTIETESRSYEATMFPGIYDSCLPYLKSGNPVVMKGTKDYYHDKATIQCQYIRNMTNSGIRDCPECHIRIDNPANVLQLIQLKQMFDEHPGMTQVVLHVTSGYYDMGILVGQPIALNDRIIEYCETIGKIAYKPI